MEENNQANQSLFNSKLEERVVFFFVCMGVIAITYGVLFALDFLPEKPKTEEVTEVAQETPVSEVAQVVVDPLPVSIIFDSLDNKEIKVLNPETDAVAALDAALLTGVVRHPNSADFKNTGTIFLLGHSSYLPVVRNKNFQAFNGIQKLVWGDTIRLRSLDTEYVYSVDRVYEAKAADAEISVQKGVAKLTLATCNSFGTKDDRFVVEATLVDSHPIKS